MEINTQEDYWKAVNERWYEIMNIFRKFCDTTIAYDSDHHQLSTHGLVLAAYLDELRTKHDPEISRWFNQLWAVAPDQPWIHGIPGWGTLCDLCSETWVFDYEGINEREPGE